MKLLAVEEKGSVVYVTINRQKVHNALNIKVISELGNLFSSLEKKEEVMVVVITGSGKKAFVAGADVEEIKNAGNRRPELIRKGQEVFSKIRNSTKVVIAAINGYALGGGCELALSCDIRICSDNAKFGFPEVKLGLMPGYGGTQLLTRLVGLGKAKYLILSGEIISAQEAYEFGLVEKVCKSDKLMHEVAALATKIASNGPLAVKASKIALNEGINKSLDDGIKREFELYSEVARSCDAEEGIRAFLEKRKARFEGK